ncbi:caspase-8 [Melanotaenia boesemani]|uniref:caspase-8 n=1 Tax=Melanotaenia boesemani TaxID=1250792 RepID=UPI001C03ECBD|nr:caspase-8 [Melanotaenia boesemani]
MEKLVLYHIDEELDSSEVAQLCFLCSDVMNRKSLEKIKDAKTLFSRLEEKGLLENSSFLCQLLETIHRADLLRVLQNDNRLQEETDAVPILSNYRVMLYKIYEDMTQDNLSRMKFLLSDQLGKRQLENSKTALDLFTEMEKMEIVSKMNVTKLYQVLQQFDQQLATTVWTYMEALQQPLQEIQPPHYSMDQQGLNNTTTSTLPPQPFLSIADTQPSCGGESIYSDAQPDTESSSLSDETEYYSLTHKPRGLCVVINNEHFTGPNLRTRAGTQADANALKTVFTRLGFQVVIHNNLTAEEIRRNIHTLGTRRFSDDDALVLCVLSHGEKGCVYGSDEKEVRLQELTESFRSGRAPTLAGKPKLFFIQACQGKSMQIGAPPCLSKRGQNEEETENRIEDDASSGVSQTVPWDADFLLGMATVAEYKSFRNTSTGSIYIQELCKQLDKSARSSENDDILTVLTRVNREVSKGVYLNYKQMPEPKYTLTKKLVFKYV